ncbi:hypothetical protein MCOR25_006372 [Pyricularia grisea]|uniref:Uncharacterized protein n=1 Tax=Pyricularia grisea TaxID=148305 RepID=A0A6P8AR06_PYRGI|nr:uncharacterized protein PgNI_12046 [Pyricularia grisea]KAI6361806.1 hypothetical protein MCOR25_006372 [Pyricularia grisea]TLD04484.1 hypothetical protein PgNI_12046 [Pyricularia grisea]
MSFEPQPPSLLYPNAAAAEEALKDFALQNGFDLIIAERYPRGSGDNCTRLTFRCVRGRAAKPKPTTAAAAGASSSSPSSARGPAAGNAAAAAAATTDSGGDDDDEGGGDGSGGTPAKKRRRARSQMTGCPYRINIKMQKYEGMGWRIDRVQHRGSGGPGLLQGHNHDLCLPTAFSTFRHRNLKRHEARILELYRQGRKPREILAQIEKDIEERRAVGHPGEENGSGGAVEIDYHGQGVGFSYQDMQNMLQRKKRDGLLEGPVEAIGDVAREAPGEAPGDAGAGRDSGDAEKNDANGIGDEKVKEPQDRVPASNPAGVESSPKTPAVQSS